MEKAGDADAADDVALNAYIDTIWKSVIIDDNTLTNRLAVSWLEFWFYMCN